MSVFFVVMVKTLTQIVTAALSFCLAQPSFGREWNGEQDLLAQAGDNVAEEQHNEGTGNSEVKQGSIKSIKDTPRLEDSVCPATVELVKLSEGRNIVFRPLLFCYQESQPEDFLTKYGYMMNVKAYYTVTGTVVRDSWSGKGGYPQLLRQIIVSYDMNDNHYAIRFITDPKADGRGLADRPGEEVIDIHVTYPDGKIEKNGFIWMHMGGGFIFTHGNNTTMKAKAYSQNTFDRPAAKIMRFLRRKTSNAHGQLKLYYIKYMPEKEPNNKSVIFVQEDIEKLHKRIYNLERRADKVNGRE